MVLLPVYCLQELLNDSPRELARLLSFPLEETLVTPDAVAVVDDNMHEVWLGGGGEDIRGGHEDMHRV